MVYDFVEGNFDNGLRGTFLNQFLQGLSSGTDGMENRNFPAGLLQRITEMAQTAFGGAEGTDGNQGALRFVPDTQGLEAQFLQEFEGPEPGALVIDGGGDK